MTRGMNCTTQYNVNYGDVTTVAKVRKYSVGSSPYKYALLGTKTSASSGVFHLAAMAPYDQVFQATTSTSAAHGPANGVYWYFYNGKSMGFAPASTVQLGTADVYNTGGDHKRVSWHLDSRSGGYRDGKYRGNGKTSSHFKVVLYCNPRRATAGTQRRAAPARTHHDSNYYPLLDPAQTAKGPRRTFGTCITGDNVCQ